MKKLLFLFVFTAQVTLAQVYDVTGVIKDATTNETLIGATVLYADGKGTQADINGKFALKLPNGSYTLKTSFIGYEVVAKKIVVNGAPVNVVFNLPTQNNLKEVEITADVAKNRETPVAFSSISAKQIQQELGTRDLPTLLTSTPGVYVTESGGGAGDARISIRGFDQRNVGMMLDGIPFNDMENGAVYWSNWSGLGGAVQNMQVQRGLGASKLALPSVGGTINVITKGISDKRGGKVTVTQGNNDNISAGASYNSGIIGKGFGFTAALNYQQAEGYVDKTWSKGVAYFLKMQRRFNRHLVSFSVNGANQSHAQRFTKTNMATIDTAYALKHGFSQDILNKMNKADGFVVNKGLRYNQDWGRYVNKAGDTTTLSSNVNYYTKPVLSLSDYWTFRENMYWSNIAYLSIGKGGGAFVPRVNAPTAATDGQISFIKAGQPDPTLGGDKQSSSFLRSSVNNHFWYGALSTLNIDVTEKLKWQMGVDLRSYNGTHYQTPVDMLDGDYVEDSGNKNQAGSVGNSTSDIVKIGDRMVYDYTGIVRWAGAFTQMEYKNEKISAFVNLTNSYSFYKRVDRFAKRDIVLDDTTALLAVGFGDTLTHNGKQYTITSPEARVAETNWAKYVNYSIKGGANYNLTDHHNLFVNAGYLVLPPRFVNVFDRNNRYFSDIKNQIVKSIELGYGFRYKTFSANVNAYYSVWENKPQSGSTTGISPIGEAITLYYNINGINALHKGAELDFKYKPFKQLTIDGAVSFADWIYTSNSKYTLLNIDGSPAESSPGVVQPEQSFSAKGVHVGDAAQNQFVLGANYEPIKSLYIKLRGTYFGKNYSNFNPATLSGA
ncbi:MAG: TonB-dependent receptor, partial [Bacteroidia bacterium]